MYLRFLDRNYGYAAERYYLCCLSISALRTGFQPYQCQSAVSLLSLRHIPLFNVRCSYFLWQHTRSSQKINNVLRFAAKKIAGNVLWSFLRSCICKDGSLYVILQELFSFTWDTFSDNTQRVNTAGHPWDTARRKREGTGFPVPSQKCLFIRFY